MGYAWDVLAPANVTRVMQTTQSVLTYPQPLLWHQRAQKVNASDDELTMRDKSYVFAADVITADAKALIRDSGQFTFEQHQIAKLKHGFALNESQIKLIRRIERNRAMDNEILSFKGLIARRSRELMLGIHQRQEAMINGMLSDSFSYDKLGIKLSGTFGMPSDLKVTPSTLWTDAANATPIADIINFLVYAMRTYGEVYNRITMRYEALQKIIATTEFKEVYAANAFRWGPVADNAVNAQGGANPGFHMSFLANFISAGTANSSVGIDGQGNGSRQVTIEIYEGQYREASNASTIASPVPFHPAANKLVFTNSADDNSSSGWDWGNGEVIESVLAPMGGTSLIGGTFEGDGFGPIGYATQADANLNPPGIVLWAAAAGGPRKHRETCSAVLTAW